MTTLACDELPHRPSTRRLDWYRAFRAIPHMLWRARERRRDRITLLNMSERMLRDVGVSRWQADRAAREIRLWR